MKMSIIRGLFLFVAGAGCATVVAQMYPLPPITVEEFQERMDRTMRELVELGAYVHSIDDARIKIGLIACTPTPLPKMPAGAVDPRQLSWGVNAVFAMNNARMLGDQEPVAESVEKCRPVRR
ncbi:MAG: hypothetical protein ABI821_06440 [Pseudomonadota bacterium]